MRNIKVNYNRTQARNNNLGVYPCLARIVKYKRFSRKSLLKVFKELMPKDDYLESEKKDLVDYLDYLTNIVEEGEI